MLTERDIRSATLQRLGRRWNQVSNPLVVEEFGYPLRHIAH